MQSAGGTTGNEPIMFLSSLRDSGFGVECFSTILPSLRDYAVIFAGRQENCRVRYLLFNKVPQARQYGRKWNVCEVLSAGGTTGNEPVMFLPSLRDLGFCVECNSTILPSLRDYAVIL